MKLLKSKKGFTLIELLVVIGILAVLAAIAIPSVAGLIDRANASADKTNANEMTNAIERFASEYELYCQDIASGAITSSTTEFDAAQGRVYNVTKVKDRAGIETLEVAEDATVADNAIAIYRDTKYPANAKTMQAIVENYTKTSSATFTPKQSDMHYWYSPDCGVVVVAKKNTPVTDLNKLVVSGMDAKGNELDGSVVWIDMTNDASLDAGNQETDTIIPAGGRYIRQDGVKERRYCDDCGNYALADEANCRICGSDYFISETIPNVVEYGAGDAFLAPKSGDIYIYEGHYYCYGYTYCHEYSVWGFECDELGCDGGHSTIGWTFTGQMGGTNKGGELLSYIGNEPLLSLRHAFVIDPVYAVPTIPNTVIDMYGAFTAVDLYTSKPAIPSSVTTPESDIFQQVTYH